MFSKIVGGLFIVAAVAYAILVLFAYGMSDAPSLKPSFEDFIISIGLLIFGLALIVFG